jgi:hypothetical protein
VSTRSSGPRRFLRIDQFFQGPRSIEVLQVSSNHANPEFQWRAHPASERRVSAIAAFMVIVTLSCATYLSFGIAWALASLVILIAALNRFFFPSRFAIDPQGITARYPLRKQRMHWADLRRFVHDQHGAYLSTRSRTSRFDAYSGMHVLFGRDRDAVMQQIRARFGDASPDGGDACQS